MCIVYSKGRQAIDVSDKAKTETKQTTIAWHIDDLMVTCKDDLTITKFVICLAKAKYLIARFLFIG